MGVGSVDRGMLRGAAEFARLLKLEILGIFIEDRSVLGLSTLPFARELRLPGHDWQALEPQRVARELQAAAEQARRLFREEVESQGVICRFEVQRGDPATLVSGVAETTDILIVAEPIAANRLGSAFAPTRRAALASAAAVLLLPPSGMPQRGPVVVVAAGTSDPCFLLASRIAAAMGEEALVIPPTDEISTPALMMSLQRTVGYDRERMLVLARSKSKELDEMPLELAAQRNVPVLIVDSAGRNAD
jgi:hypothetical protein